MAVDTKLLHVMVKSSVVQNKTSRDTIQMDSLQKAEHLLNSTVSLLHFCAILLYVSCVNAFFLVK